MELSERNPDVNMDVISAIISLRVAEALKNIETDLKALLHTPSDVYTVITGTMRTDFTEALSEHVLDEFVADDIINIGRINSNLTPRIRR